MSENSLFRQGYLAAKVYVTASLILVNATSVPEFVYIGF